jgi:hypothetical protein
MDLVEFGLMMSIFLNAGTIFVVCFYNVGCQE